MSSLTPQQLRRIVQHHYNVNIDDNKASDECYWTSISILSAIAAFLVGGIASISMMIVELAKFAEK